MSNAYFPTHECYLLYNVTGVHSDLAKACLILNPEYQTQFIYRYISQIQDDPL